MYIYKFFMAPVYTVYLMLKVHMTFMMCQDLKIPM